MISASEGDASESDLSLQNATSDPSLHETTSNQSLHETTPTQHLNTTLTQHHNTTPTQPLHNTLNSTLTLQSTIDLEAKEMVRSVGSLLRYLTVYLSQDRFQGDAPTLPIQRFVPLELDRYMMIDRVEPVCCPDTVVLLAQPRHLHHRDASLSHQGPGQREAGLHHLQPPRPSTLPARTTPPETVVHSRE